MKIQYLICKPTHWRLAVSILLFLSAAFGAHHESPVALTDPIEPKIEKGEIVVAVEKRFRLPRLEDMSTGGATTNAHARIQYLLPVGDGSGRVAINDLRGSLYMADADDTEAQLYLNLRDYPIAFDNSPMPNECGFLGFAFHPDFSAKGRPGYGKFYTAFSARTGSGEATYLKDDAGSHESVLVEWTATDPAAVSFEGTYRELFRIGQFAGNHNIGTLAFNPNAKRNSPDYGNLYFCLGDGGGGFDPKSYGQSLEVPHGAILRIDPLGRSDGRPYGIPNDNPFVSHPNAAPEIWAYGLRHPQQFSWDKSGRMFICDIGQRQIEEVNIGVRGGNFGWRIREGTFATGFEVEGIEVGPVYDLPYDGPETFIDPVAQYDHDEGRAVGGGFAYEGKKIGALKGKFVFSDIVAGRLFYIDMKNLEPGKPAEIKELRLQFDGKEQKLVDVAGHPNTYHPGLRADSRLGIDEDKELYVLTKGDGWVRKLVSAD